MSYRRSREQQNAITLPTLKGNAKFIENIHSVNKIAKRNLGPKFPPAIQDKTAF